VSSVFSVKSELHGFITDPRFLSTWWVVCGRWCCFTHRKANSELKRYFFKWSITALKTVLMEVVHSSSKYRQVLLNLHVVWANPSINLCFRHHDRWIEISVSDAFAARVLATYHSQRWKIHKEGKERKASRLSIVSTYDIHNI